MVSAQTLVPLTGTNVLDANGQKLASGTLQICPVTSAGLPLAYHIGGGGVGMSRCVSVSVTNGAFSTNVVDTYVTSPQNLCLNLSVQDPANYTNDLQGMTCVQPSIQPGSPAVVNGWCTANGSCDLDNYSPAIVALPQTNLNLTGTIVNNYGGSFSGGTVAEQITAPGYITGPSNTLVLGTDPVSTTFGLLSLNGDTTAAGRVGISGSAGYGQFNFFVPSNGFFTWRVGNTLVPDGCVATSSGNMTFGNACPSFSATTRVVTASTSVASTDGAIYASSTAGSGLTFTLPALGVGSIGHSVILSNQSASTVTLAAGSGVSLNSIPTSLASGQSVIVHYGASGQWEYIASNMGGGTFNGGTVTNPITLPADPAANLQAATKQYVDYSPTFGGRTVYQQSAWTNLNDFTVDSANVTAAVSNGEITLSGSGGNLNGYLALNASEASDEDVDFEVTFQLTSAPGTSSAGISIGKLSMNTRTDDQPDLAGWLDLYTSGAPVLKYLQGYGTSITQIGSQALGTIAQGDVIRLIYSQRGDLVTTICDDFTQGTSVTNQIYTAPHPSGIAAPNMSKLAIWVEGGQYTLLEVRAVSRQPLNPNVAFIGDSKTFGYGLTGGQSLRYASLLDSLGPVAVYAGQGDMTAQVLAGLPYVIATHPKYALLSGIYYNDLAESVSTATIEANYSSIVSQLKAAGIKVVHQISTPDNAGVNLSTLNAWVTSTFASDPIIDPTSGWDSGFYSADNVHPNAAGYAYLANLIATSGDITPRASIEVAPLASTAAQYGLLSASDAASSSLSNGIDDAVVGGSGNYSCLVWGTGCPSSGGFIGMSADKTGTDPDLYLEAGSGGMIRAQIGGAEAYHVLSGNHPTGSCSGTFFALSTGDGYVSYCNGSTYAVVAPSSATGYLPYGQCATSSCTIDAVSAVYANVVSGSSITLPSPTASGRTVTVTGFNGDSATVSPASGWTLYGVSGSTGSISLAGGHSITFTSVVNPPYYNWYVSGSN